LSRSDSNVGRRRPSSAPDARAASLPSLARLVLFSAGMVALLAAGCVIPVGPQFQDPLAAENLQPVIIGSGAANGSVVTAVSSYEFWVVITDPNVGDPLYVMWSSDYPPQSAETRFSEPTWYAPRADGQPLNERPSYTFDCKKLAAHHLNSHRIRVAVADRPFVPPELAGGNLEQVEAGGSLPAVATWILNLPCP
jgi:hypothetical protein